jgi:hypothetical protein
MVLTMLFIALISNYVDEHIETSPNTFIAYIPTMACY